MVVFYLIFLGISNLVTVIFDCEIFLQGFCAFSARMINVFISFLGQLVDDLCIALKYTHSTQKIIFFPSMDCFEALSLSMSFFLPQLYL